MDWREIPSLSALRGFEAAARLKSLSAAARSLNVTHAAIAQHVRALEDHFGCALLVRDGRGMAPTPEGVRLAEGLADGFGLIATAVHDTMPDEDRPLRITMTPSFAENWLVPAIAQFWAEHPDIRLELLPSIQVSDFRAEAIDLAIRYGHGGWPGTDPVPLAPAGILAIAAPGLIPGDKVKALTDLADAPWVLDRWRPEEVLWAQDHGLDLNSVRVTKFETSALLLQAVRGGVGVSLFPEAIVARDIADGKMVPLFKGGGGDAAYHLVRRPGPTPPSLEIFIRWLRQFAG